MSELPETKKVQYRKLVYFVGLTEPESAAGSVFLWFTWGFVFGIAKATLNV